VIGAKVKDTPDHPDAERLMEVCNHCEYLEVSLKSERDLRRSLALNLLDEGLSERAVGKLAGVSGSAVHQWRVGA